MKGLQLLPVCLVAAAALAGASVAAACSLPADPYVEVRVSAKALDGINSPEDFIKTAAVAGTTDPLTHNPKLYVTIPEDSTLHFLTFWDLTQGGKVLPPTCFDVIPGDAKAPDG